MDYNGISNGCWTSSSLPRQNGPGKVNHLYTWTFSMAMLNQYGAPFGFRVEKPTFGNQQPGPQGQIGMMDVAALRRNTFSPLQHGPNLLLFWVQFWKCPWLLWNVCRLDGKDPLSPVLNWAASNFMASKSASKIIKISLPFWPILAHHGAGIWIPTFALVQNHPVL